MKQSCIFFGLLFLSTLTLCAQPTTDAILSGRVLTTDHQPVAGASVSLKERAAGTLTDSTGAFRLTVSSGRYGLVISAVGLTTLDKTVTLRAGSALNLGDIRLKSNATQLAEVTVQGHTEASAIERTGFSVEAIETKVISTQTIDLNRVLDHTAGIRVRQSGGMGSDFRYTINGLTGKSIRFFVDGIPMDYFGTAYSINNFPTSLVERIDVYKGVTPVELGSDALGGSINLITRKTLDNFAEASYSFGSFNTHQAAVQGQWRSAGSGLTARLSAFYNYSGNSYRVWGPGVTYADAATGYRPVEFTARRFNDDFRTVTVKPEIGITGRRWADQATVGAVVSDLDRGIQTGQTMAYVYGKARYTERFVMPYLTYLKTDFLTPGLTLNLFSSYGLKTGTTTDTTINRYDWRGDVVATGGAGEISGGGGKSIYTLNENALILRGNVVYELGRNQKLAFNYLLNDVRRTGADEFQPWYRVSYLEPQSLQTQFAGLSYESKLINERLNASVFVKRYAYTASVNDAVLTTTTEGVQQYISRAIQNLQNTWGGGVATSFKLSDRYLLKASIEQATRMPDATEALGDGITIVNNPRIRPEQSLNINGGLLTNFTLRNGQKLKVGLNAFYRDTEDLLLFTVLDNQGNGQYQNVSQTLGRGIELDVLYQVDNRLAFTANTTYQDIRNNQRFDLTNQNLPNLVYRDRLRNTPYLMANAGARYTVADVLRPGSKLFAYIQSGYVHKYFLNWPSLGAKNNKSIIPTQWVQDVGVGYTFPNERHTLAFDATNILNEQVYDNFLLQRPGRALFVKWTYKLNQAQQSR